MHRHAGWHAYQEVKGFCYDYQNGQQGFGVTDINFTELWPRKDKYNIKGEERVLNILTELVWLI